MRVSDIMTRALITVAPQTPAREIARLLVTHGISAVPVIDAEGKLVGIVGERDLIGQHADQTSPRREWWLSQLAQGHAISTEFLASLDPASRSAETVMTRKVVTVDEEMEADEVARLMVAHGLKRLPVVRDGKPVGIVSRIDLVRQLSLKQADEAPRPDPATVRRTDPPTIAPTPEPAAVPVARLESGEALSADGFRDLVSDFHRQQRQRDDEVHRLKAEQRQKRVSALIAERLDDAHWHALLRKAAIAAGQGLKEYLLLSFPCELCTDRSRAINVPDPHWPETLRGLAADLYSRWLDELRPAGFGLSARVTEFPDGIPAEVGLFLVWGG
ncbi:MAG: CBS domain-containing protein [Hyphomicrobiaceae bacterium]|nr:CBS domain-containing protein [Hyphomicrobiaceae bacterium]